MGESFPVKPRPPFTNSTLMPPPVIPWTILRRSSRFLASRPILGSPTWPQGEAEI